MNYQETKTLNSFLQSFIGSLFLTLSPFLFHVYYQSSFDDESDNETSAVAEKNDSRSLLMLSIFTSALYAGRLILVFLNCIGWNCGPKSAYTSPTEETISEGNNNFFCNAISFIIIFLIIAFVNNQICLLLLQVFELP